MKNIILIAVLSVLVSCSTSEKKELKLERGIAIVKGKVHNFENASKVISFSGSNVVGDISQTAIIDSLGNFRTEIELFHPQNVTLYYENGGAYLYLKPNDSLFIEFDSNSLEQDMYEVSGSNPSTSKYIRDFFQFHNPYSYEPNFKDSISVDEYLSDLEQQMSIEDSVLHEFIKQYNPTEEFMHWAKKNMKYTFANYRLLYFYHFDPNHKQYKTEIFDNDLFPVDDDSAFVEDGYNSYLNIYLWTYYLQIDSVTIELYNEKDYFSAYSRILDKVIKCEKQGLSRDVMLFHVLNQSVGEDFVSLFSNYGKRVDNQVLVNILQEKKYNMGKQGNERETILDLKLNTKSETIKKFWKTISSKHKNKIIYIDIWTTWCAPCLGEIPHAIDLHNYFEEKPIAFVNLCLASKKDDWKKTITQNHIKGDNYFFNKDETALLRGELKFAGYPTYMIIDKNGGLIDKNAPRPSSDDEIKNILNTLLDK